MYGRRWSTDNFRVEVCLPGIAKVRRRRYSRRNQEYNLLIGLMNKYLMESADLQKFERESAMKHYVIQLLPAPGMVGSNNIKSLLGSHHIRGIVPGRAKESNQSSTSAAELMEIRRSSR